MSIKPIPITTYDDLNSLLQNNCVYYKDIKMFSINVLIDYIIKEPTNRPLILTEYVWKRELSKLTKTHEQIVLNKIKNMISDLELDFDIKFNDTKETEEYINKFLGYFDKITKVKKIKRQYDISKAVDYIVDKLIGSEK